MNERLLYRTAEGKLGDGSNCRSTLRICIPANVLLSQELAVFLAYARSDATQSFADSFSVVKPSMGAAASTSFPKRKEAAKSVLMRMAIFDACGTSSRSRSSRFVAVSPEKILTPVTFPPGLFRLATKPSRTGSSPLKKTIGIVLVKPLTAATEGLFAKIAVTRRLTKSAASAGKRHHVARRRKPPV